MNVFDTALGTLFADANVSVAAVWRNPGAAESVALRVVRSRPNEMSDWSQGQYPRDGELVEIRAQDVASPARDDLLRIDGVAWRLAGDPVRREHGRLWETVIEQPWYGAHVAGDNLERPSLVFGFAADVHGLESLT